MLIGSRIGVCIQFYYKTSHPIFGLFNTVNLDFVTNQVAFFRLTFAV